MKILLLFPVFALASCSTLERAATPENFGRAFIILDEGRRIYESVVVTPEK